MSNELTTIQSKRTDEIIKNMWKRPGGGFAKVTALLTIGVIAYFAVPAIIAFTTNLIIAICELVALALIVFLLTNKDVHRWLQLMWLQINRKIYGCIVNIDPISILENGIKEMRKKLDLVHTNVTKLNSLLIGMEKKYKEYEETFESNIAKKKSLEEMVAKGVANDATRSNLQLVNNNITRGKKQIDAQRNRIDISKKYLDIMKKLETAANFRVQDAENELSYRKDEYEQAKAQQKAINTISSIMHGGLNRSLEEELAIDQVSTTVNDSLAEMARLIDGSNDILVNFELDNAANSVKADQILQMFETGGFDIFKEEKINDIVESKYITNGKLEPVSVTATPVEEVKPKYFN